MGATGAAALDELAMLEALETPEELEALVGAAALLGCTVTVTRLVVVVVTVNEVQVVVVDSAL